METLRAPAGAEQPWGHRYPCPRVTRPLPAPRTRAGCEHAPQPPPSLPPLRARGPGGGGRCARSGENNARSDLPRGTNRATQTGPPRPQESLSNRASGERNHRAQPADHSHERDEGVNALPCSRVAPEAAGSRMAGGECNQKEHLKMRPQVLR